MRKSDDADEPCPSTLGEYRDLCCALALHGPQSAAVAYLDEKIDQSPNGRNEVVIAADSQMRVILMPMLLEPAPPKP